MSVIPSAAMGAVRYSQPDFRFYYETESKIFPCSFSERENTEEYVRMNADPVDSFNPYVRQFTQHWNAFLEREDELTAEIYSESENGMIGVVFVPVKRDRCSEKIRIRNEGLEAMRNRFPNVSWSDTIPRQSFFETLDEAIIVVKPNLRRCWTEDAGAQDADDTIGIRFTETMPEEWKKNIQQ